ncbi:MAG TPA: hypothetical protein VF796_23980 [Humisphaera sp.]
MTARAALLLLLLAPAALTGCSSARSASFDIDVRNASPAPVTITLTKDGPPFEAAWASPEDLTIETPKIRERRSEWAGSATGMAVVPPGKSASIRGFTGKFDVGTQAILRVYSGEPTLSQMVARGPKSFDRVDVPLNPGPNRVVVKDQSSGLKVEWDK